MSWNPRHGAGSAVQDPRAGVASAMAGGREPAGAETSVAVVVDVDALGADGVGDLALIGLDVLLQPHALLGDRALLHDGLLGVQRDLVLLLGDGRTVQRRVAVGFGDRLALDADLLAPHRHGLGHLVLDDILLQPDTAGLALGRADSQLLLGARHPVSGVRAADAAARPAALSGRVVIARVDLAGRRGAVLTVVPGGAPVTAIVVVEPALFLVGQAPVGVDARRVLDLRLLVRDAHAVAGRAGVGDRDEGLLRAEQPGGDDGPFGLVRLLVEVDLLDRADLVAVVVDQGAAAPALDVFACGGHEFLLGGVLRAGRRGR